MMTRLTYSLLGLFLLLVAHRAEAQNTPDTIRVGVVMDSPATLHTELLDRIQTEVDELTRRDFSVEWPASVQRFGDGSLTRAQSDINALLANDSVDVVLALGVLASHVAATQPDLSKPVLAPSIIHPEIQGVPFAQGTSGKTNLNYLTLPNTLARDMAAFNEMVGFEAVSLLVPAPFAALVPNVTTHLDSLGAAMDVTIHPVLVGSSVDETLAALQNAEAVYALPLPQLSPDAYRQLIDGLTAQQIPSFSYRGAPDVEQGVLAALNPDITPRLARRVALNLHRILLGDAPESLPVTFAAGERLVLNMETAQAIGFAPSVGTLLEAELIGATPETQGRALTLSEAVLEGVASNLLLDARARDIQAGAANERIARSTLRPQIEISSTGLLIDADRAEASLGTQAQYSLNSAVTLRQVLYAEPARANVEIQQHLQTAREQEYASDRLDLALQAADVYLNVLRAQTFEQIQANNLHLTRTNLELARVRRELGQARAGELLRWGSELARNRKSRIDAFAQRRVAAVALNQTLNRPLDEPFQTVETTLADATQLSLGHLFEGYVTTIPSAERLGSFLVTEGINQAPELAAIDAALAARERLVTSRERAIWSPTVALQGQASSILAEGGEGTSGPTLPSTLPANLFPQTNELDWNVGVNVSLPLSTGGKRDAERIQAQEELAGLQFERELARQRIEQNIRTSMHFASAAFAGINEAETAAEAARQTLDLVVDAYAQGVADAVEVLEAQSHATLAEEAAANAVFDFLRALMRVERATGQFGFFRTDAEQAAFSARAEAYMAQN